MKQLLTFNPIFTPGAPGVGTLDFSLYPNFDVNKLYAVIDLTTNIPLYIPGAPGLGIVNTMNPAGGQNSAAVGTILTLQANTSTCNQSDNLSIFYDTQAGYENNTASERGGQIQQIQENTAQILRELVIMNYILTEGMNLKRDDVAQLRQDITNSQNTEYTNTATW